MMIPGASYPSHGEHRDQAGTAGAVHSGLLRCGGGTVGGRPAQTKGCQPDLAGRCPGPGPAAAQRHGDPAGPTARRSRYGRRRRRRQVYVGCIAGAAAVCISATFYPADVCVIKVVLLPNYLVNMFDTPSSSLCEIFRSYLDN